VVTKEVVVVEAQKDDEHAHGTQAGGMGDMEM
jgi:hypothetical protein